MASKKLFTDVLPFPDDVPTIPMCTISLEDLRSGDERTTQRMFIACQELGIFLLDLHGDEVGARLMREIDELFRVGKDIMGLPEDVKQQYLHDIPRSFLG